MTVNEKYLKSCNDSIYFIKKVGMEKYANELTKFKDIYK